MILYVGILVQVARDCRRKTGKKHHSINISSQSSVGSVPLL